jgi:tRNA U34 5-methylaminomethyl-2-thiouridine-forming methyltransferase MnmC
MKNHEYKALTIARETLEVVKNFLKEEDAGNESARQNAKHALKNHLVETEDGSYTLKSASLDGKSETMHTHHGALSEAMEKFVKPAHLGGKKEVSILDICSGLGYNTASCIVYLGDEVNIKIDMVEISLETLALTLLLEAPLESYRIIQKAVEDKLYGDWNIKYRHFEEEVPENIRIDIHIEDARVAVGNLVGDKTYEAIFLDPFSPLKSPELYTVEFFRLLKSLLKPDGIILTYTSAAPVRAAMAENGLHVGEGPSFGRSGGTVASLNEKLINKPLSMDDERMIALSDAGIPFKDPDFNGSSQDILKRREEERKMSRGKERFSSTVKTPIYLNEKLEDGRLKRRVLNNLNKLGFTDLNSPEARYVVCPQYTECICDGGCGDFDSSRERIYEMNHRLRLIVTE